MDTAKVRIVHAMSFCFTDQFGVCQKTRLRNLDTLKAKVEHEKRNPYLSIQLAHAYQVWTQVSQPRHFRLLCKIIFSQSAEQVFYQVD